MRVSEPRKVLVVELAGLGDNVHLLPALWLVRRRWPDAELHVMVNAPAASLFKLTPWVDHVWAYPSGPKPGLMGNLEWAWRLRGQRYDWVINTTGSDRSSLLTWVTAAPVRMGRRPADRGPPGWRWLFTHVLDNAFYLEPMYVQKWRALKRAGFGADAGEAPEFRVSIDPELRRDAGINAADEGGYIHLSPFTTADRRELPGAQMAELVAGLGDRFPRLRVALSCAGTGRELDKLAALSRLLPRPPWKIYPGTLDAAGLAAVIQTCAVNLSGDSGSLHLAMMAATPAVAWFRPHKGEREWIPLGPQYRVLFGDAGSVDALHGIANDAILETVANVLEC